MTTTLTTAAPARARRRWTEESIAQELAPLVAELGRMPTRAEATKRGAGAAWAAMQRRGGAPAFAPRLVAREHIERRAYFLGEERGGDPVANWLAAESELLLAAAVAA